MSIACQPNRLADGNVTRLVKWTLDTHRILAGCAHAQKSFVEVESRMMPKTMCRCPCVASKSMTQVSMISLWVSCKSYELKMNCGEWLIFVPAMLCLTFKLLLWNVKQKMLNSTMSCKWEAGQVPRYYLEGFSRVILWPRGWLDACDFRYFGPNRDCANAFWWRNEGEIA